VIGIAKLRVRVEPEGECASAFWNALRTQSGDQFLERFWRRFDEQIEPNDQILNQLSEQLSKERRECGADESGMQSPFEELGNCFGIEILERDLEEQAGDDIKCHLQEMSWDGGRADEFDNQFAKNLTYLFGRYSKYESISTLWMIGGQRNFLRLASFKFAESIGIKFKSESSYNLDIIDRIGRQCEWWWPFDSVVIACERSASVRWDDAHRLHCENGPAIEYADGVKLFFWHGVRVPSHWVMNRSHLDPKEVIQNEGKQGVAGANIVGWSKMLSVLDYRVIEDSGSDSIGQLIELTFPGLRKSGRFLKAVCPQGGVIVEGVPRVSDIDNLPIETAIAAQAWRIGEPQSEYHHRPRQGKVTIIQLDTLPQDMETKPVEKIAEGWIVSRSEGGNHHILTGGDVIERTDNVPIGMKVLYALLDQPASLIRDAAGLHERYDLDPGVYCLRIARECNPFAYATRSAFGTPAADWTPEARETGEAIL